MDLDLMVHKAYFTQFENSSWGHQPRPPSTWPLCMAWEEWTELEEKGPEEKSSLCSPPCLTFLQDPTALEPENSAWAICKKMSGGSSTMQYMKTKMVR